MDGNLVVIVSQTVIYCLYLTVYFCLVAAVKLLDVSAEEAFSANLRLFNNSFVKRSVNI